MKQQDAAELRRLLLSKLSEGEAYAMKVWGSFNPLKQKYKQLQTPTEHNFYGHQVHRVSCLHCEYDSWSFGCFSDLIITIRQKDLLCVNKPKEEAEDNHFFEKPVPNANFSIFGEGGILNELSDHEDVDEDRALENGENLFENFIRDNEEFAIDSRNLVDISDVPGTDIGSITTLSSPQLYIKIPEAVDTNLGQLIDYHFQSELLNSKDNYSICPNCEDKEIAFATRAFRLFKPPRFLTISLKRFEQHEGVNKKVDDHVKIPHSLDISKYCMRNEESNPRE